jgi:hypothetical protein
MTDRFVLESKAIASLTALMEQAATCRSLFEAAGMALPDPLRRMLGDEVTAKPASSGAVVVPPPASPPRPPTWESDWIWLPIASLTPTTLVCALLRQAKGPLSPKQIMEELAKLGVDAVKGSVANIGTRLSTGAHPKITRGTGTWSLVDPSSAPVLHEGYVWGPVACFDKQELAAHRRIGVMHLLRVHDDGLQIMQITQMLRKCEWMRAPLTKDLVKDDLPVLQGEGLTKRVGGGSGKWRAAHKND